MKNRNNGVQFDRSHCVTQSVNIIVMSVLSIFRYVNVSSGWSQFFLSLLTRPSRALAIVGKPFALAIVGKILQPFAVSQVVFIWNILRHDLACNVTPLTIPFCRIKLRDSSLMSRLRTEGGELTEKEHHGIIRGKNNVALCPKKCTEV